jgi:aspartate racemase
MILSNAGSASAYSPIATVGTLPKWSGQRSTYPREQSVAQLFERRAKEHAGKVALICGERRLTYAELNRKANRLARKLRDLGIRHESMVGVCLERSAELIVAVLAVLKAGGAYVPVDAEYPSERISYMLADTQTSVMVTQRSLAAVTSGSGSTHLIFIEDIQPDSDSSAQENLESISGPESLAYVLYTSGSTGRPKGVLVENRSIVRLVFNTNYCRFGPEEVFLQFAPISFDASTFEIWGALLHGATLVIMPAGANSLAQIGKAIREHNITTAWLTGGLFNVFVDERIEDLKPLQQLLAGGDVLSARHVRRVLEAFPHLTLINGYGPTEGTTFTCCHVMRHGDQVPDSVPIGRPISNTFAYILDENLNPAGPDEEGDLFAAGDGVARGYLNTPDLTNLRFLPDPFLQDRGARMYRTGDRARLRRDGFIEFLGRADNQVKIRGYRIELGEIETALVKYPGILQACIIAKSDDAGNKQIAAYYVTSDGRPFPFVQLKDYLSSELPPFSIPSFYTAMAALPLDPNGKIDRAALKSIPLNGRENCSVALVAPRNETERVLQRIWQEILGQSSIGVRDDFFQIGGDSLSAARLVSQVESEFNIELPLSAIIEVRTIEDMAALLTEQAAAAKPWSSLVAVQTKGSRPPLFCVHSHTGDVLYCEYISQGAGKNQPIYGLQAVTAATGRPAYYSIEEMAQHYFKEIRAVRPKGPYHLFGFCFGGMVAFEIARLLESAGEEVRFLGCYNSPAPGTLKGWPLGQFTYLRRRARDEWRKLRALEGRQQGKQARIIARNVLLMLHRSTVVEGWRTLSRISGGSEGKDRECSWVPTLENVNIAAAKNFFPERPISAPITYFVSPEVEDVYPIPPEVGWRKFSQKGLTVIRVPLDEKGWRGTPFVECVGGRLGELLQN